MTTSVDNASQLMYNSRITAVFHLFSRFTLSVSGNSRVTRNPFQTLQKYHQTCHQPWQEFCRSRRINPITASLEDGLKFLYQQYENGLSYSGINTARSARSTVLFLPDGGSFGNHPLVSRLLKGVFESRPSLPRYKDMQDVCCFRLFENTAST